MNQLVQAQLIRLAARHEPGREGQRLVSRDAGNLLIGRTLERFHLGLHHRSQHPFRLSVDEYAEQEGHSRKQRTDQSGHRACDVDDNHDSYREAPTRAAVLVLAAIL
jgi:hypothetical protein